MKIVLHWCAWTEACFTDVHKMGNALKCLWAVGNDAGTTGVDAARRSFTAPYWNPHGFSVMPIGCAKLWPLGHTAAEVDTTPLGWTKEPLIYWAVPSCWLAVVLWSASVLRIWCIGWHANADDESAEEAFCWMTRRQAVCYPFLERLSEYNAVSELFRNYSLVGHSFYCRHKPYCNISRYFGLVLERCYTLRALLKAN